MTMVQQRGEADLGTIRLEARKYAREQQNDAQRDLADRREVARDLVAASREEAYEYASKLESASLIEQVTAAVAMAAPIASFAVELLAAPAIGPAGVTMIATKMGPTALWSLVGGSIGQPLGSAFASGEKKAGVEAEARGKALDLHADRSAERISRANERVGDAADAAQREQSSFLDVMRRGREAQGLA